jgi:HAD superfamily hydrolase (TIGR01450 family)
MDNKTPDPEVLSRLRKVRHLALDLDGTVYLDGTLLPGTPPFLAALERLRLGHTFLTNNSSRSRAEYTDHLRGMGIQAKPEQIHISTLSAIDYLRQEGPEWRRLFLVGTAGLATDLRAAGYEIVAEEGPDRPDAVVVGFDTALTYRRLCRAAWWIDQGCPWVATHPDRTCPTHEETVLIDCGAITRCLEEATGKSPLAVTGKPDPGMLTGIIARNGLASEELAMVGDRLYTDLAMARRAGVLGVLVLTGETDLEMVRASAAPPDLVLPSLRELGALLQEAQAAS